MSADEEHVTTDAQLVEVQRLMRGTRAELQPWQRAIIANIGAGPLLIVQRRVCRADRLAALGRERGTRADHGRRMTLRELLRRALAPAGPPWQSRPGPGG